MSASGWRLTRIRAADEIPPGGLGISRERWGGTWGSRSARCRNTRRGRTASVGRLFKIAEFLDVPVQYFFEGLGDAPRARPQALVERNSELVALNDAFRSITDPDTRRSVVALVCSLAAADAVRRSPMARLPRGHENGTDLRR